MSNFKVDASTFASIKQHLVDRMKANPAFADYDFLGSRLNNLMDVLAYNTLYSQAYSNAALMEGFQQTALNRNSIVLKAQEQGYSPAGRLSSMAPLNVTLDAGATLPRYTTFEGIHPSGKTYNFVNWDSYTFVASTDFIDDIIIYQGDIRFKQFTWLDNTTRLLIRDTSIDRTRIRLTINGIVYTKAENAVRVNSTATVFYTRETIDGFTEIYFGEGEIETRVGQEDIDHYVGGLKPINNDVIQVEYLASSGADANGSSTFTITGATVPTAEVTINTPNATATTGANKETKERIKGLANKMKFTQNRAVTADDYQVLVLQEYGSFIASILAWGDKNKPGFAFISIKPSDGLTLPQDIKNGIQKFLSKYNILTIQALVVDPDYMFIEHSIEVDYRLDQLKTNEGSLEDAIINSIDTYYNNSVEEFNKSFHLSKLLAFVDNSNPAILGSSAKIKMIKENGDFIDSDGFINFSNPTVVRGLVSSEIQYTGEGDSESQPVRLISTDDGKIVIGPFHTDDQFASNVVEFTDYTKFNGNDYQSTGYTRWLVVGLIDYVLGSITYDISSTFLDSAQVTRFGNTTLILNMTPTETDIYTSSGQLIAFENQLRPEYTTITLEGIS
ncbi:baseplate wedge subunit [Paraglaciecola Antarctic GD virus 1]|nr:baseplate wedge subunit [Paraglaciecola Antarctic GD virus 1]